MELSPLAREKLERIGALSEEEKAKIKLSEELDTLLSEYFTHRMSPEDLWQRLKTYKEKGHDFLIREAQKRLLETIKLGDLDFDLQHKREAILALETLKEESKYGEFELGLNQLEKLRKSYQEEKERVFNSLKQATQRKVELAARQLAQQGKAVDVEGSVEANVRASQEWRDFLAQHERTFGERFRMLMTKLKKLV